MTTALVLVIALVVLIAVAFYVPRLFLRRAVRSLVALFRKHGATDPKTAATPQELGVVEQNYVDKMFKRRDYRPLAARVLAHAGIIRATDDGRVYLCEEELERSPLKRYAPTRPADDAGQSLDQ